MPEHFCPYYCLFHIYGDQDIRILGSDVGPNIKGTSLATLFLLDDTQEKGKTCQLDTRRFQALKQARNASSSGDRQPSRRNSHQAKYKC
eukprot:jgi/Psemu1/30271/gm1.30271_g